MSTQPSHPPNTPEELECLEKIIAYEEECLSWESGRMFPPPPPRTPFITRPCVPSDDPEAFKIMQENYSTAMQEWMKTRKRDTPFPIKPKRCLGRNTMRKSIGRPRRFSAREIVSLEPEQAATVDQLAVTLRMHTRADVIRHLINLAKPGALTP